MHHHPSSQNPRASSQTREKSTPIESADPRIAIVNHGLKPFVAVDQYARRCDVELGHPHLCLRGFIDPDKGDGSCRVRPAGEVVFPVIDPDLVHTYTSSKFVPAGEPRWLHIRGENGIRKHYSFCWLPVSERSMQVLGSLTDAVPLQRLLDLDRSITSLQVEIFDGSVGLRINGQSIDARAFFERFITAYRNSQLPKQMREDKTLSKLKVESKTQLRRGILFPSLAEACGALKLNIDDRRIHRKIDAIESEAARIMRSDRDSAAQYSLFFGSVRDKKSGGWFQRTLHLDRYPNGRVLAYFTSDAGIDGKDRVASERGWAEKIGMPRQIARLDAVMDLHRAVNTHYRIKLDALQRFGIDPRIIAKIISGEFVAEGAAVETKERYQHYLFIHQGLHYRLSVYLARHDEGINSTREGGQSDYYMPLRIGRSELFVWSQQPHLLTLRMKLFPAEEFAWGSVERTLAAKKLMNEMVNALGEANSNAPSF